MFKDYREASVAKKSEKMGEGEERGERKEWGQADHAGCCWAIAETLV